MKLRRRHHHFNDVITSPDSYIENVKQHKRKENEGRTEFRGSSNFRHSLPYVFRLISGTIRWYRCLCCAGHYFGLGPLAPTHTDNLVVDTMQHTAKDQVKLSSPFGDILTPLTRTTYQNMFSGDRNEGHPEKLKPSASPCMKNGH